MSRNNEDRFKAHAGAPPPLPLEAQEPQAPSPGLNFTIPTEFVELPSKGKFYPPEHPLYNQETVEIRYMTAKEEDILTSPTLLKKNLALDRLLESILLDKNIKVDDLLSGDKNALLVASRVTGYGSNYKANVTCPLCYARQEHEFYLSDVKLNHGDNPGDHGVELTADGTYLITLPKSGVTVETRLMTGKQEKVLANLAQTKKKHKMPESTLMDQLKVMIVSANGVRDNSQINRFINNMPAQDSAHLRSTYEKVVPNVDLSQEFACSECGNEEVIGMPFSAEFFWPKR